MSQTLSDYFAREAGEYLAELERLLRSDAEPDADRIFRLARGVRGSAQVAQADGVAEVAARLEGAARFVLEGRIPWSDDLRDRSVRTVADLGTLISVGTRAWGPAEDALVEEAVSRWGGFGDVVRSPTGIDPVAALTGFVRTELDGLLRSLDGLVGTLRLDPSDASGLDEVLRRIRTLRGIAAEEPLAAAAEVLGGCEEVLHTVISGRAPLDADRIQLLQAALSALHPMHAALERGAPPPRNAREIEKFRQVRDRIFGSGESAEESDVVPIHTLFFDDGGPTIVASPRVPAPTADREDPPEVESFLRHEAASLIESAEGLLAGAEMHAATDPSVVIRRIVDLAGSFADLAETYRRSDVAALAREARRALGDARTTAEARELLPLLRERLAQRASPTAPTSPRVSASRPEPDLDVVPIEALLLRGGAAVEAAIELRPPIERLIGREDLPREELASLLAELWDLLELGRSSESDPA